MYQQQNTALRAWRDKIASVWVVASLFAFLVPSEPLVAFDGEPFLNPSYENTTTALTSFIFIEKEDTFPVSGERQPHRTIWVLATAYSLDRAQTDASPCIPANGENLCDLRKVQGYHNTIATNFLRFDTRVRLPSLYEDKMFVVRDRMNKRYNGTHRIDIVMESVEAAKQFGVKWVQMELY